MSDVLTEAHYYIQKNVLRHLTTSDRYLADDNFSLLHTRSGQLSYRRWYRSLSNKRHSLTHIEFSYIFRDIFPQLPDAIILELFETIDGSFRGEIGSYEAFMLLTLLLARREGHIPQWLFYHGSAFFSSIAGGDIGKSHIPCSILLSLLVLLNYDPNSAYLKVSRLTDPRRPINVRMFTICMYYVATTQQNEDEEVDMIVTGTPDEALSLYSPVAATPRTRFDFESSRTHTRQTSSVQGGIESSRDGRRASKYRLAEDELSKRESHGGCVAM
ncbi:hypothetical protein J8273_3003 [Carpediemonas membranifera]|uniref:Uncharacterized protein n=1 Tax=Carpediemonas membranifera TaxID=201153 RepID=A0A8J6BZE1_9EUKA|nr:hypothetical protein J8273_3003 [Carpediemonas membranifera]|eukprot:KAG9395436.1 hypothetical protein J8273_3003 [Carpediemonas membranifera]